MLRLYNKFLLAAVVLKLTLEMRQSLVEMSQALLSKLAKWVKNLVKLKVMSV
jgi:hypothetical protein